MKYMVTWWERPSGSPAGYEAAQKRIHEIFQSWQMPESLTFHQFLVRLGEFGGYAVVETDDVAALERLAATFAVFQFRVEPVMDVMDAVAAQVDAVGWRDALDAARSSA
jgi:muconolactone delta-isomerase